MPRVRPVLWATMLFAGLSVAGLSPVRADTIVTLEGVTFADGGTASGYFVLNVDGYLETMDITTTSGTSMQDASMPGSTYTTGLLNNSAPFDTAFYFNSSVDAFSLALTAENPVTNGGFDPLILGSGSLDTLGGSYENCQENPSNCSGLNYLDGRLVTAGTLYAPEPTTLSLLGMGGVLLSVVRRKRTARSA